MRARTTYPGVIICLMALATVCGAAPGAVPLAQVGRGSAPAVDGQLTEPGFRSALVTCVPCGNDGGTSSW